MVTMLDKIRGDHQHLRRLLRAVSETHGDTDERRGLFADLCAHLEAHAAVEERLLYARLLADPRTRDGAIRSIDDHEHIRSLLDELAETSFSSSLWLIRLKGLRQELEHHMDAEEEEIFEAFGRTVDSAQHQDLALAFEREKAEAMAGRRRVAL
jgi:hemerythrin superfamily protein